MVAFINPSRYSALNSTWMKGDPNWIKNCNTNLKLHFRTTKSSHYNISAYRDYPCIPKFVGVMLNSGRNDIPEPDYTSTVFPLEL
jgi:hypothetical protein